MTSCDWRESWTDESWASTSCVKFNRGKCQVPHVGWCNPGYRYKFGKKSLERVLWKGIREFGLTAS